MNQGLYQDWRRRLETILPESARDLFPPGAGLEREHDTPPPMATARD